LIFDNLRRDAAVYASLGAWYRRSGFWVAAVYRFGVWAYSLRSIFVRLPAVILYRIFRLTYRHFNMHLLAGPSHTRIGPGLCLRHPYNVFMGFEVEIGANCTIFHEVTLGVGPIPGYPKIGDGVTIYVGARILGGVTIGDHSIIGANCVVVRNVPPNSVVLVPPPLMIPRALSSEAGR
jgi:serine O-acetyltransferase